MRHHARKRSEQQGEIPGRDRQAKDKASVLPPTFRVGLDPEEIKKITLGSGFMERRPRKIEPSIFLQALVLMTVGPVFSMRALAIHVGLLSRNVVSKVAVFHRMKPAVIDFVREALLNSVSSTSRLKEEIVRECSPLSVESCCRTARTFLFLKSLPRIFQAQRISRVKPVHQLNFRPSTTP